MNTKDNKTFRIKYDIHCKLENFFNKEILVKNCMNELHAKLKLGEYIEKKYGKEFECIQFKSVKEEYNLDDMFKSNSDFGNVFNDIFGKK